MPGSGTAHLRGMVRDNNPVVAVFHKDTDDAGHIDVTFVNKNLVVFGNLAHNITKMDIGDFPLPDELFG